MAFEPLEFTKNWENAQDFPTYEPSETQVRADLQWLHNETRDGLNRLVAALNDPGAAAQLPFQPAEGLTAGNVRDAILEVYAAARDAAASELVDGSITKEKLAESLLERIYGGRVWVSLDTPGSGQDPQTDFPVGQLWLRPAVTVENLALDTWTVSGWAALDGADDWTLTTDGTAAESTAVQVLEGAGSPGQRAFVHLLAPERSSHLSQLLLILNDVEYDLIDGGGVYEAQLDGQGALEITVKAVWYFPEVGQVVRLQNLAVVNADRVDGANGGCRPMSDWGGFLQAHVPFSRVALPRTMFVQHTPGLWSEVDQEVLPVDRGGTGLCAVARGQLLYGGDGNTVKTLDPPGESGSVLAYAGSAPAWRTKGQMVDGLGILRVATGSYTGSGGARTITLPVTPKFLYVNPDAALDCSDFRDCYQAIDQPACLVNGATVGGNYAFVNSNGGVVAACATIKLSGNALSFGVIEGYQAAARYLNQSGKTYHWTALY